MIPEGNHHPGTAAPPLPAAVQELLQRFVQLAASSSPTSPDTPMKASTSTYLQGSWSRSMLEQFHREVYPYPAGSGSSTIRLLKNSSYPGEPSRVI